MTQGAGAELKPQYQKQIKKMCSSVTCKCISRGGESYFFKEIEIQCIYYKISKYIILGRRMKKRDGGDRLNPCYNESPLVQLIYANKNEKYNSVVFQDIHRVVQLSLLSNSKSIFVTFESYPSYVHISVFYFKVSVLLYSQAWPGTLPSSCLSFPVLGLQVYATIHLAPLSFSLSICLCKNLFFLKIFY
jgi:hypothetical protein